MSDGEPPYPDRPYSDRPAARPVQGPSGSEPPKPSPDGTSKASGGGCVVFVWVIAGAAGILVILFNVIGALIN